MRIYMLKFQIRRLLIPKDARKISPIYWRAIFHCFSKIFAYKAAVIIINYRKTHDISSFFSKVRSKTFNSYEYVNFFTRKDKLFTN